MLFLFNPLHSYLLILSSPNTGCSLNIVFPKILKYSGLCPFSVFPRRQCVYTHQAGRKPTLQQNWQISEKSQNFKKKTQYLMNTQYIFTSFLGILVGSIRFQDRMNTSRQCSVIREGVQKGEGRFKAGRQQWVTRKRNLSCYKVGQTVGQVRRSGVSY